MTKDELKEYYLGRFIADSVIDEIVQFIRYATTMEISTCVREGLISREQLNPRAAIQR